MSPQILLQQVSENLNAGDYKSAYPKALEGYGRTYSGDTLHTAFAVDLARILIYKGDRGSLLEALRLLSEPLPKLLDDTWRIRHCAVLAIALRISNRNKEAEKVLAKAKRLEHGTPNAELESVRGELLRIAGHLEGAATKFVSSYHQAELVGDEYRQMTSLLNLGLVQIQSQHFDDALDSMRKALPLAERLRNRQTLLKLKGNLGLAQLRLGNYRIAEIDFQLARQESEALGLAEDVSLWARDQGLAKLLEGDREGAKELYALSLQKALELGNDEQVAGNHADLGDLLVDEDLKAAASHLSYAEAIYRVEGNQQKLRFVHLLQAIALARSPRADRAWPELLAIEQNTATEPDIHWQAEQELALLAARQGKDLAAHRWFNKAVRTFQQQQCSVRNITSRLPFQANGADLFQAYVEHLIGEGRIDEALIVYDKGRATSLRDCKNTPVARSAGSVLNARGVAKNLHGTLLVYYLLPQSSYLWAVSSDRTSLYHLPGVAAITKLVDKYQTLIAREKKDPVQTGNDTGRTLYDTLIGPAQAQITRDEAVYVLADRGLSKLNFDTLITPGNRPHFWIEDVTVVNASSLHLLAQGLVQSAHMPNHRQSGRLLLIGDPAYSPATPKLLHAAEEMKNVAGHFAPGNTTISTGASATPSAFIKQDLTRYANIHVVAHAKANEISPLDSYLLLAGEPDKIYAYDIANQSLKADLVTLSVCDSSGTNSVAGEGLVGLAWAFQRAGARNVIGTLWEVDDQSAVQFMDHMYTNLANGMPPERALREAKLNFLHSSDVTRKPYYWAQFQLYSNRPELRNQPSLSGV